MIGFGAYVALFLFASAVVAFVTAAIRLEKISDICSEALRFFLTIAIGIGVFSLLVAVIEWIFIRPLV